METPAFRSRPMILQVLRGSTRSGGPDNLVAFVTIGQEIVHPRKSSQQRSVGMLDNTVTLPSQRHSAESAADRRNINYCD